MIIKRKLPPTKLADFHPEFREAKIAQIDNATREVLFVASDESVDSYGDIVRVDGWELDRFKKNPVLLFAHDSGQPPIGHVTKIYVEDTRLMALAKFLGPDVSSFADKIFMMVQEKVLRACSVGFWPTKAPNEIKNDKNEWTGGLEWVGQELMELSVVPVPANPNALVYAKSHGVTDAEMRQIFVAQLHDARGFISHKRAELELLAIGASR